MNALLLMAISNQITFIDSKVKFYLQHTAKIIATKEASALLVEQVVITRATVTWDGLGICVKSVRQVLDATLNTL